MRILLKLILLWACSLSIGKANDELLLASAAPTSAPSNSVSRKAEITNLAKPDLNFLNNLHLDIHVPYCDTNEQSELTFNNTNDKLIIEYKGLEGLVVKHIQRQCRRYYERELQNLWDSSSLHPMDLGHRIRQFRTDHNPDEIKWWERSWMDSLPIEKGGSKICTLYVGSNQEVIEVGPLMVTNAGKFSWSGWKAEVVEEYDTLDKLRDGAEDNIWPNTTRQINKKLSFGVSLPSGNIAKGQTWDLSGSVRVNIKANGTSLAGNRSAIRGYLEFRCYNLTGTKQWLNAEMRVTARPLSEEYVAELVIGLVAF